jgi:DNA-binding beta-propeller fold protein YncE
MRWPWRDRQTNDARALDGYWDEVVRAIPAMPVAQPDEFPDLARIIRQLHAAEEADRSRPAYEDRLLQRLLAFQESATADTTLTIAPALSSPPIRRDSRVDWRSPSGRRIGTRLSGAAAFAVVLIVVLVGTQFANTRWHREERPAVVSSPPASPTIVASPGEIPELTGVSLLWSAQDEQTRLAEMADVAVAPNGDIYAVDCKNELILVFSADGTYLESWGGAGTEPGQFNFGNCTFDTSSEGLANLLGAIGIDRSGNIYVFDSMNNRVQKFGPDHSFITQWGTYGSGIGQFNRTLGTVDAAHDLVYVADLNNQRIQVFDLDGNFIRSWKTSTETLPDGFGPFDVAVDSAGNVYVSELDLHMVQKFDPTGKLLGVVVPKDGPGRSFGIALDAHDNLYVSFHDAAVIDVYRPDGTAIGQISTAGDGRAFRLPGGLAFDGDGNLLVASGGGRNKLVKLSVPGDLNRREQPAVIAPSTPVATPGATPKSAEVPIITGVKVVWSLANSDDPLSRPGGLGIAQDGTISVGDVKAQTINRFGPDGTYQSSWGAPGKDPGQFDFADPLYPNQFFFSPISFDSDGNMYVFDSFNDRIQKFNSSGEFVTQWGEPGHGDGQFDIPLGTVDAKSGRVYVADSRNNRVRVFDVDGTFLFGFGTEGTGEGQFTEPIAIAFGPDGNVYVGEGRGHRIQVFDPDGKFLRMFDSGEATGSIRALAFDSNGNLYAALHDQSMVRVYTPDGAVIGQFHALDDGGTLFRPVDLTFTADGHMIIACESGPNRLVEVEMPAFE